MKLYSVAALLPVNIDVEAESPEEARELAANGEGDIVETGEPWQVADDACVHEWEGA